jgi:UDP-N-acetylmuramoyl-L-alanyl-D-glutamate--2,6-diaminopimelate ligase
LTSLFPESLKIYWRILRGLLGSVYYGNPAKSLTIIGVTGTSGKSTTANMIYHMLDNAGISAGVISTVGAKIGEVNIDTGLHVTTPNPIQMQKILKLMVSKGATYVVIETSSQALAQWRNFPIKYDYAVYTNITRDHLDWHKTWLHYAKSKAKLMDLFTRKGKIIINRDDESYSFLKQYANEHGYSDYIVSYSQKEISNFESSKYGIKFDYKGRCFEIPVIGAYNIENLLATITLGEMVGLDIEDIVRALNSFKGVKGRMDVIQEDPFLVIVDFAHNTDSLKRALLNAKDLVEDGCKLITIFSSAGLRDTEKRYTMGEVAGEIADVVITTIDDPRTENVYNINSKIIEGAKHSGMILKKRFATSDEYKQFVMKGLVKNNRKVIYSFDEQDVQNRYDAIDLAIKLANKGDVVLLEGKGHEASLAINDKEYPFSEHEAALKVLSENLIKEELKVIKFSPKSVDKVKSKEITRTLRIKDEKGLVENEEVRLAIRDGQKVEFFAEAKIVNIAEKTIKDLKKKDLVKSDFKVGSVEEFRKFYGDNVKEKDIVKIIDFVITKLYEE